MDPMLQSHDCVRSEVGSRAVITPTFYCQDPAGSRSAAVAFQTFSGRPEAATRQFDRSNFRWALFLALLVGSMFGLHWAITLGLRKLSNSAFGATNRLVDGKINAQIIVTGSSRALVHYDPRIIGSATGLSTYNIGRNGAQTDLQLAVLKTYLVHNAKPRLIVHNLDLYSGVTSHEIYEPTQYVPYLGEKAIYRGVARVYPDVWKWKYLPLYGYLVPDSRFTWLLGIGRLVGIEPRQDHFDGFVPRALSWTGAFDEFRKSHPTGVRTPVEPQGVRDLEELILLCRGQKIPLVFVYSPEYIEIQPFESNRDVIFSIFRRMCRQYDVPLWDYSDSVISHQRGNFYNSQHLNMEGASLFSQDFGRRLKESGLFATHQLFRH